MKELLECDKEIYKKMSDDELKAILKQLKNEGLYDNSDKTRIIEKILRDREAIKLAYNITEIINDVLDGNRSNGNSKGSSINEISFKVQSAYKCYKSELFKTILDNQLISKNVFYEFTEIEEYVIHFKVKIKNYGKIVCKTCSSTDKFR